MSFVAIGIKGVKLCAFCKYWWDPSCQFIRPYLRGMWYYDNQARCKCTKTYADTMAYASCNHFRCKIDAD